MLHLNITLYMIFNGVTTLPFSTLILNFLAISVTKRFARRYVGILLLSMLFLFFYILMNTKFKYVTSLWHDHIIACQWFHMHSSICQIVLKANLSSMKLFTILSPMGNTRLYSPKGFPQIWISIVNCTWSNHLSHHDSRSLQYATH